MTPDEFVQCWKDFGGAELANSQSFLKELCDLLGVPHPDPTVSDVASNRYVFEKAVEFNNGDGTVSNGRVDLFRSGCFVLESKQGSERKAAEAAEALATVTKQAKKLVGTAARGTASWDRAMQAARKQAKGYAEAIPDEWPPFLVVVDIGYCFDLYADFTGSGKNYVPFPDPRSFRIPLARLRDEKTRHQLQLLWTQPHALDPSKRSADVTREIATRLAKLANSLESQHDPEVVAGFLMRCLFTMFAEDVELIRKDAFKEMLLELRFTPEKFAPMAEDLWTSMDQGKFSGILKEKIRHFNGKFFKDKTALPLNKDQLELLIEAAQHKWEYVEPAIFGTLLERALDPVERHKLGAHYTPRAYVERLVMPTIIEPLRAEWDASYAAAILLDEEGRRKEAVKLLREFHGKLCETRVLDPACGSGNFLYVSMELMKRLEGEVIAAMASFGDHVLPGITIDPHQFLGIEINPRAAALAELVLWIGYIQWHRRTRTETTPPEPILKDYGNIECRDAVLEWDSIEPVVDADGRPVTRWDGRTTKPHPVTGEEVPDETARVQELRYINPRKAEWPQTDYIVGNPPFIGNKRMRFSLGDGYSDAIREAFDDLDETCDYVMYWWEVAGQRTQARDVARFGFITTNSIRQSFNRKVVSAFVPNKLSLVFVIPDHPWVDSATGASVRIAMTTAESAEESRLGVLAELQDSRDANSPLNSLSGLIQPNLRIGAAISSAKRLNANTNLVFQGCKLVGKDFQVSPETRDEFIAKSAGAASVLKEYWSGSDVTKIRNKRFVIDFFGLGKEEARKLYPEMFQHVNDYVMPVRLGCRRESHRENWWLFGEKRPAMRFALRDCRRFIATSEVAKHRTFVLLDWPQDLADGSLAVIAHEHTWVFGVLSSKTHTTFASAAGGRMGVGNDLRYQNGPCFDPFPFPNTSDASKKRISDLAEQLDAHRKR